MPSNLIENDMFHCAMYAWLGDIGQLEGSLLLLELVLFCIYISTFTYTY